MHIKFKCFFASVIVLACFIVGCESVKSTLDTNQSTEDITMRYYVKEDFDSIIIGESNFEDLYHFAKPDEVLVMSFGLRCKYPMQNGGYVEIDCYGGDDNIVGAIREKN